MAPVRVVEVENFRAVKNLRWLPGAGINCLIGPGDSGKSTILDAIDLCLGARRSLSLTEDDFHALDFGEWTLVSLRAQAQLGRSHAHRARQARRHRRHASDVATRLRANQTHRCQDQRVSSFAAQRHPFLASHAPPALTSFILVEGVAAAGDVGVPAGDAVQALMSMPARSPLRALGLGSSRLLIAALQRKAAENATTFLIDELEYGLEPYRYHTPARRTGREGREAAAAGFCDDPLADCRHRTERTPASHSSSERRSA